MSKAKRFKPLDLVENIKSGKIEMVESFQNCKHGLFMFEFITKKVGVFKYHFMFLPPHSLSKKYKEKYRLLSPKDVKINLDVKPKK